MKDFINNEKGFIGMYVLMLGMFFLALGFFLIITIFMSMNTKGVETYNWFKAGVDFAGYIANEDGNLSLVVEREGYAKQYFRTAFADMTGCSLSGDSFIPVGNNFPGPITLKEFRAVSPGEIIPYGIAKTPGYYAELEVPIFGGSVPFVGPQYVTVDMRYFSVVGVAAEY